MKIINDNFQNYLDMEIWGGQKTYIISDPPYNQGYHYNDYKDTLDIDEYGMMIQDAFGGYQSVIISYPEESLNIVSKVMDADWCGQSVAWVYNSNTATTRFRRHSQKLLKRLKR